MLRVMYAGGFDLWPWPSCEGKVSWVSSCFRAKDYVFRMRPLFPGISSGDEGRKFQEDRDIIGDFCTNRLLGISWFHSL